MTFGNKKKPLNYSYNANGSYLSQVSEYKYLGVIFSHNLKWHAHINHISAKALRKLGYLKRTLKNATLECKLTAYKSLVRPILDYASTVWSPHLTCDITQLESIQKKAIRFIFGRYDRSFSPSSHAHILSLQTLEHRRKCERVILLHKIVHTPSGIHAPFSFVPANTRVTRQTHRLNIIPFRTHIDCFKFSFFPFTVEIWNNLDGSLRALTHDEFVEKLRIHI